MWNIAEAAEYYRKQGAPGDYSAMAALLRETRDQNDGVIPQSCIAELATLLDVKESYLLAVMRRVPGLRLMDSHTLQLCAGPNCGKAADLAKLAEQLCREKSVTLTYCGCMRLCGKGPNLKLDGKLYHGADEALLRKLLEHI